MPARVPQRDALILTVNGGSSSVKFAAFTRGTPPGRISSGQAEGSGAAAVERVMAWLDRDLGQDAAVAGIGHRIVHGGPRLLAHQAITPQVLDELRRVVPLDPLHLPGEIALIEAFARRLPGCPQVACFDTVFHRNLPVVAQRLPIPRTYAAEGVRRYGFHGLSYTYLMDALAKEGAAGGRIILAHLGAGASMAAVRDGRPVDTTMAFTPTAGLVMGTRPGDLDPGLVVYLMREGGYAPEAMDEFLNRRCGLLGLSETSADMRELLQRRDSDPRAAEAVAVFCYQARKWIGALAAALGGLDTLVFSGGIGEHAAPVRAAICQGLEFLGAFTVRVIPTDEELVIAQAVQQLLPPSQETSHERTPD